MRKIGLWLQEARHLVPRWSWCALLRSVAIKRRGAVGQCVQLWPQRRTHGSVGCLASHLDDIQLRRQDRDDVFPSVGDGGAR